MTAPKRPAIDEATDLITSVRNASGPYRTSVRDELGVLTPELLRRMADEKAIVGGILHCHLCSDPDGRRCPLHGPFEKANDGGR